MPSWAFVRDSLLVAAIVVIFAGAAALTLDAVLGRTATPDLQNPVVVVLYALGIGLTYILWRSQSARATAPLK